MDPKFLNRLAIEEAISITTTLLAQYERRKGRFFEEIDYVLTDTIRGSVVDFFTVWLPAPTISFLSYADGNSLPENLGILKNLLGSIPDNAFQKAPTGVNWNLNERVASVIFGGLKLSGVGFISSIGAGAISSVLYIVRKSLNPSLPDNRMKKKASVLKSALVYGSFLGTSANLRYQVQKLLYCVNSRSRILHNRFFFFQPNTRCSSFVLLLLSLICTLELLVWAGVKTKLVVWTKRLGTIFFLMTWIDFKC